MKKIVSIITALLICITLCVPALAVNMPDFKVKLEASHVEAKPGDTVKISLSFENASAYPYGLGAFCAQLSYNKDKVKVKKVETAASRSDVTSNNTGTMVKTLYVFASATAKPGFNTDSVFSTVTFEVLPGAAGKADFSLTFDNVTVCDYNNGGVKNYQVAFNSPSVSIDLGGEAKSEAVSSTAPQSGTVESNATGHSDSKLNDGFKEVAEESKTVTVDTFDDDGKLTNQSEIMGELLGGTSKSDTSSASVTASKSNTSSDTSNQNSDSTAKILLISLIAVVVIALAAVAAVVITKSKSGKK